MEKCEGCGKQIELENPSIVEWVPYYWDYDKQKEFGTLCPVCAKVQGIKIDEKTKENYKGDPK